MADNLHFGAEHVAITGFYARIGVRKFKSLPHKMNVRLNNRVTCKKVGRNSCRKKLKFSTSYCKSFAFMFTYQSQ